MANILCAYAVPDDARARTVRPHGLFRSVAQDGVGQYFYLHPALANKSLP
jgi:hypothetical protein